MWQDEGTDQTETIDIYSLFSIFELERYIDIAYRVLNGCVNISENMEMQVE